jgi:Ca2+-binding RTX toxin-like protein
VLIARWRNVRDVGYGRVVVALDSHPARARRLVVGLSAALALAAVSPGVATAAVTSTFSSGALTVSSNAFDTIVVDCVSGSAAVTVNGNPGAISPSPPACSQVTSMTVNGGAGNWLRLDGINPGEFPNISGAIAINGGTSADTIDGSQVADTIAGGGGGDTLNGNGGNDTFNEGGNLDIFDGGAGIDTLNCTVGISFFTVSASAISHDAGDWTYSNLEIINAFSANSDSGYNAQSATARVNGSSAFTDKNDSFVTGPFDDSFNGGPAFIADTIVAITDSPILTLTNSSLTGTTTGLDSLISVESASFTSLGGTIDNTWDASGFTPGAGDNVGMLAGPGNDTLIGTGASDSLNGEEGNDVLSGRGSNETLIGGPGIDTAKETGVSTASVTATNMTTNFGTDGFNSIDAVDLTGTGNGETLGVTTFTGPVKFDGAAGADTLNGGSGNDDLTGGTGVDNFSAGPGNDTLRAQDATADGLIACGTGDDTVFADDVDKVESDCETVTRPQPPGPGPGDGGPGSGTGEGGTGGSGPGTGGPAGSVVDVVKPVASVAVNPSRFSSAGSGGSIASAAGTRVTYQLSEPATALFRVQRARPGRRVGGRCVAPTRANRNRKRCTRWVRVRGSFSQAGQAGSNTFRFTGRVGGRRLRLGRYRLVLVATDGAGNKSAAARAPFRIIRRR